LCVMQVLDEFEPKEVANVVSFHKCIKQILNEFPDVMKSCPMSSLKKTT